MLKRLVAGALFAGLSAGVLAAALQFIFVVPLIQEGELYESGALEHFAAPQEAHDHAADAGHEHADAAAHEHPAADRLAVDGFDARRAFGSFAMFLVSYTGFALLIVAGFALAERAGHVVTARQGLVWGLAGFLAVQLAPAFGLPPELPGGGGAPLQERQVWWAFCVVATIGGLWLVAFGRSALALGAAVVLIAAPHVIGAPEASPMGVAPPELAAHFVTRALGVGAVSWAILGTVAAVLWTRREHVPVAA